MTTRAKPAPTLPQPCPEGAPGAPQTSPCPPAPAVRWGRGQGTWLHPAPTVPRIPGTVAEVAGG